MRSGSEAYFKQNSIMWRIYTSDPVWIYEELGLMTA
jgi:hypothetical protein